VTGAVRKKTVVNSAPIEGQSVVSVTVSISLLPLGGALQREVSPLAFPLDLPRHDPVPRLETTKVSWNLSDAGAQRLRGSSRSSAAKKLI